MRTFGIISPVQRWQLHYKTSKTYFSNSHFSKLSSKNSKSKPAHAHEYLSFDIDNETIS